MLSFIKRLRTSYVVFFAAFCFNAMIYEAIAAEIKDGTILFMEKDGTDSCTIPFKTGTYNFKDGGAGFGCENDDKSMIELNDVPSATTVLLTDTDDCNKKSNQNYWVEFKTIKQPTNVKQLLISQFFEKNNGDVIVPGIRLIDAYRRNDDSLTGKLSCVVIKRSDLP